LVVTDCLLRLPHEEKGDHSRKTLAEDDLTTQDTQNWNSLKEVATPVEERLGTFFGLGCFLLFLMRVKAILFRPSN